MDGHCYCKNKSLVVSVGLVDRSSHYLMDTAAVKIGAWSIQAWLVGPGTVIVGTATVIAGTWLENLVG